MDYVGQSLKSARKFVIPLARLQRSASTIAARLPSSDETFTLSVVRSRGLVEELYPTNVERCRFVVPPRMSSVADALLDGVPLIGARRGSVAVHLAPLSICGPSRRAVRSTFES